ncbi:MAG: hypothetical protein H6716_29190 [Polyangiaceae bacterium]|nr:hypothetical protein [Polyangiaceae bacterium]
MQDVAVRVCEAYFARARRSFATANAQDVEAVSALLQEAEGFVAVSGEAESRLSAELESLVYASQEIAVDRHLQESSALRSRGDLAGALGELSAAQAILEGLSPPSTRLAEAHAAEMLACHTARAEPQFVEARRLESEGDFRGARAIYIRHLAFEEGHAGVERIEGMRASPQRARRLSALLPGVGQFYAHRRFAGAVEALVFIGALTAGALLMRSSNLAYQNFETWARVGDAGRADHWLQVSRRRYYSGMGLFGGASVTWAVSLGSAAGGARRWNRFRLGIE